jgi:hypothetical protein
LRSEADIGSATVAKAKRDEIIRFMFNSPRFQFCINSGKATYVDATGGVFLI